MGFTGSLALLFGSVALFGRGRDGDCLPIFRHWIVGQAFAVGLLYMFAIGLIGIAMNLNWLR